MTSIATVCLALLAGLLSTLSPCVLLLVPIILTTAESEHRLGPAALAAGLGVSFTAIGLFVATIGITIGLDHDVFRKLGATLLIATGLIIAMPALQSRFATVVGPVSSGRRSTAAGIQYTRRRMQ